MTQLHRLTHFSLYLSSFSAITIALLSLTLLLLKVAFISVIWLFSLLVSYIACKLSLTLDHSIKSD